MINISNLTPTQTQPLNSRQVKNNAGGYVYKIAPLEHLKRFLILGSDGGTYYVKAQPHTQQNLQIIKDCWADRPLEALELIKRVSVDGLAPKNDQAILALAVCMSEPNPDGIKPELAKAKLRDTVNSVCRIGTHIMQLCELIKTFRGWGRRAKDIVSSWYTTRKPEQLAYQVVKYRNRSGFTHRDILRLTHPVAETAEQQAMFRYIVKGERPVYTNLKDLEIWTIVEGYELAKVAGARHLPRIIAQYGLSHEMVPDEHKKDPKVWEALMHSMPMGALVRNLGRLTSLGLIKPLSDGSKFVSNKLNDESALHKARIHPINLLMAQGAYKSGRSPNLHWSPDHKITEALNGAFYKAFKNVEPTGKNFMVAVDVSGSMSWATQISNLRCIDIAMAMAVMIAHTEPNCWVVGFSNGLTELPIGSKTTLTEALNLVSGMPFSSTDCAAPMLGAKGSGINNVDVFLTITDNETWAGSVHPSEALKQYRRYSGRESALGVLGITATEFSIADPADRRSLDIVGFDSSVPQIIGHLAKGEL